MVGIKGVAVNILNRRDAWKFPERLGVNGKLPIDITRESRQICHYISISLEKTLSTTQNNTVLFFHFIFE